MDLSGKVSIVIPIYNAEKYLSTCLNSIVKQTYANWECLLVVDGSPDDSVLICEEYARKDSRFRVLTKENGGPSSARNYGIDRADGEFLCFVDSDDYVGPQFLEHLVEPMLSDDGIMITVTGLTKVGKETESFPKTPICHTISNIELFDHLLKGDIVKGWLCNKCFRRSLIGGERLDERLRYCEDLELQLRLTFKKQQYWAKFVEGYDYYYNIQDGGGSLSHNIHNKVSMIDKFNKCIETYPDTFSKRVRLLKGALTQCRSLVTIGNINEEDKRIIREAKKVLWKYRNEAIRFFGKAPKAQIILILISFGLYKNIMQRKGV